MSNWKDEIPKGYKVVGYDHGKGKQIIAPEEAMTSWTISWPPNRDQIVEPTRPTGEARFGDRVRARVGEIEVGSLTGADANSIAAAIDHDLTVVLAAYHDELLKIYEEEVIHARRRIEEAVERLSLRGQIHVDADSFLEELGAIFGGPSAEPPGR